MRKVRRFLLATVFLFSTALFGQAPAPEAPVRIEGQTLLVLHSGVGSFSTVERAHAIEQRLLKLRRTRLLTAQAAAILENTDPLTYKAGTLVTNLAGLYKPK